MKIERALTTLWQKYNGAIFPSMCNLIVRPYACILTYRSKIRLSLFLRGIWYDKSKLSKHTVAETGYLILVFSVLNLCTCHC